MRWPERQKAPHKKDLIMLRFTAEGISTLVSKLMVMAW